ncbi:hypothetical protein BCV69DRAFT_309482 [Microstroma glucosiphilum]|uniref:FHA domain-containing protein n=1 Tax=Pseudomicrostroma glucosiphilum TaxID=1684307 RepID=A0A316UF88_9BASI|nr:hypothetical protein BCV69DRAFT_309482 [Pseudomicrostroma glucosiphilum]PWN23598.1 hypothetical protein BCV69DRAFT_309482 [Pseudomicrostroma glucosiphilum]
MHVMASQDASAPVTLRTRKFITNRLLQRRQFVLDVIHPSRPNVSRAELSEKLASLYKANKEQVVVFGMKTKFGGGRSTGFGFIYDTREAMNFEPRHRLVRVGLAKKVEKPSRKLRKERKNRAKKVTGVAKKKAGDPAKKNELFLDDTPELFPATETITTTPASTDLPSSSLSPSLPSDPASDFVDFSFDPEGQEYQHFEASINQQEEEERELLQDYLDHEPPSPCAFDEQDSPTLAKLDSAQNQEAEQFHLRRFEFDEGRQDTACYIDSTESISSPPRTRKSRLSRASVDDLRSASREASSASALLLRLPDRRGTNSTAHLSIHAPGLSSASAHWAPLPSRLGPDAPLRSALIVDELSSSSIPLVRLESGSPPGQRRKSSLPLLRTSRLSQHSSSKSFEAQASSFPKRGSAKRDSSAHRLATSFSTADVDCPPTLSTSALHRVRVSSPLVSRVAACDSLKTTRVLLSPTIYEQEHSDQTDYLATEHSLGEPDSAMPWYGNNTSNTTVQRQQGFGGAPMTPAASGAGGGQGYNGNGAPNGQYQQGGAIPGNSADAGGPVYPALHLHPMNDTFAPKQISLAPPGPHNKVKVGRQTNQKTAPHPSNGFFDSKVLSRMHAEVWCQDGKVFIKDVKSSNGTFINGERLSPEAQESEVFELHSEDLVEFGIDIVGDDNKTIIHHKVACRVYLVLTADDAVNMRNDFANMYRAGAGNGAGNATSTTHSSAMGGASVGPGAEGGLRRGKGSMSFDHILGRLQMELQKSRETGSEIGSLNSTLGELQDSLGGGLPPMQEAPYPHLVPTGATTSEEGAAESNATSSAAVAALQAQLAETQSSISTQVDKIRALESMLAEHELIKAEVGSIKSQMEEAKRELDEMANSKKSLSGNGSHTLSEHLFQRDGLPSHTGSFGSAEDFDDGASMASMDTVTPGADVGDAPRGADEIEEADTDPEILQNHVGPRAPPDMPPELAAREAAASAAAAAQGASNAAKSASSLASHADEQLKAQNNALAARLDVLESQLEEALSFGRTLQTQHVLATETVKALEQKVQSLEKQVQDHSQSVQGKITEVLEGRFSQWKDEIEAGWKQEKHSWEEERDRLRAVIEAWDTANGRLEEQAAAQIAAGTSSTPLSETGGSSSPAASVAGSQTSGQTRRRASKSAKRRAAKRHLNPTLRALLYKSSHNEPLDDDEGSYSSEEGDSHSGIASSSGAASPARPGLGGKRRSSSNFPHTLQDIGENASRSVQDAGRGAASSLTAAGGGAIGGTATDGTRGGGKSSGADPSTGGGLRLEKPHAMAGLSAVVALVGIVYYTSAYTKCGPTS